MALLDAAEAFSHLAKTRIACEPAFCVKVRNRNASCDACMAVCPTQAIIVHDNAIEFHDERCSGCGVCASVCPTQALKTATPTTQDISDAIARLYNPDASHQEPLLVFCERAYVLMAALVQDENTPVPPQPFLVVPCLACFDESLYLQGCTHHHDWILASEDCASCPHKQDALISELIEEAALLDNIIHSDSTFKRFYPDQFADLLAFMQQRPSMHRPTDDQASPDRTTLDLEKHTLVRFSFTEDAPDVSRRGFFSSLIEQTNDAIAHAAAETLSTTVDAHEKKNAPKPTLARVLTATSGRLKQTTPERVDRLLNCMFDAYEERLKSVQALDRGDGALETMLSTPFSSRIFSRVGFSDSCNGCGLCATFCPTGALRASGISEDEDPNAGPRITLNHAQPAQTLTFRCNDCVSCNLCQDSCPRNAVLYDKELTLRELFSLEHVTLFDPHDPTRRPIA